MLEKQSGFSSLARPLRKAPLPASGLLLGLLLSGCGCEKNHPSPPPASPALAPVKTAPEPAPSQPVPDSAALPPAPAETGAVLPAPPKLRFLSKPPAFLLQGLESRHAVRLNRSAKGLKLRLVEGSEQAALSGFELRFLPQDTGTFSLALEAGTGKEIAVQRFALRVLEPAFPGFRAAPAVVPERGEVRFSFPLPEDSPASLSVPAEVRAEADRALRLSVDFEGDGHFDTPELDLAAAASLVHAYPGAGRKKPLVEFRLGSLRRRASLDLQVTGSLKVTLSLPKKIFEPGELLPFSLNAVPIAALPASPAAGPGSPSGKGASGAAPLAGARFRLDVEGDGRWDWKDSLGEKASESARLPRALSRPAPPSGSYRALLQVRDRDGVTGEAACDFEVDASPVLQVSAEAPKVNLVTDFRLAVEAKDADDSLRALSISWSGRNAEAAPDSLIALQEGGSSKAGAGSYKAALRHRFPAAGKYQPLFCLEAADGRKTCRKLNLEVFNARPVCLPDSALQAVVGVPVDIVGKAKDEDGSIVRYEWDLDADGKSDLVSGDDPRLRYTFARTGTFRLRLRVRTADGMEAEGFRQVVVKKKGKG